MSGRPPPDVSSMVSLKIDNLSYRTDTETLRRKFSRYGEIGDVYIPKDRRNGESRGFAFVRFYSKRDAEDAIDALNGRDMEGREIRVDYARHDRPPLDSRRGGYRGNDRYGGGGRGYGRDRRRSRSYDRRRSPSRSRSRSPRRSRSRSRSRGSDRRDNRSGSRDDKGSRSRSRSGSRKSASRSRSRSK